jgi:predicted dehydrogenase
LGVDASFDGEVDLGGGVTGAFRCSFEAQECQRLVLSGTEGTLVVDRAFTPSWDDTSLTLVRADGSPQTWRLPGGDPYQLMVEHFCDVVRGRDVLKRTPAESVALARLVARLDAASR